MVAAESTLLFAKLNEPVSASHDAIFAPVASVSCGSAAGVVAVEVLLSPAQPTSPSPTTTAGRNECVFIWKSPCFFATKKIVINNKHYFSNAHAALQQCRVNVPEYLRRSFDEKTRQTAPQVVGQLAARGKPSAKRFVPPNLGIVRSCSHPK
jgi:hypothetical protein